jgi:hypothetical protein
MWRKLIGYLSIAIILFSIKYFLANDPHNYINNIRKGYNGRVVDKFIDRERHIKVKVNSEILEPWPLTDSLWNFIIIGDSIEKIPNDNYVYLFRNGEKVKMQYLYIHRDYYTDFRWPKEWKGRWIINDR